MKKNIDIKPLDFVPAISGLIGKVSLVSSFALMWAAELGISHDNFVIENVRMEVLIGSIISLIFVLLLKDVSPAGTLSPLVVMIPFMVRFGVHPLVLGILTGVAGIITVKTGLLKKLVNLSGNFTKISVTLAFGISGIKLSLEKLGSFFQEKYIVFVVLILILGIAYAILFKKGRTWNIILIATAAAFVVPVLFGMSLDINFVKTNLNFSPSYWWNDVWQVGYGFDAVTILKTLPFAVFIMFLWAIDIVSIQAVQESAKEHVEVNLESSFLAASVRNIVGVTFGGSQTASMWRSFLIPLFMAGRRIKTPAIILCTLGIISGLTLLPLQIMIYTPLVWSVLLFGIFVPLTVTAAMNLFKLKQNGTKIFILILSGIGVFISPILTWVFSLIYENIEKRFKKKEVKV